MVIHKTTDTGDVVQWHNHKFKSKTVTERMKEDKQSSPTSISSHLQVHGVLERLQVDLGAIIRPGAELHLAALLVEGEEGDIDGAGRLVDGRRDPADTPGVEQLGLGHVGDGKLSICTGKRRRRGREGRETQAKEGRRNEK